MATYRIIARPKRPRRRPCSSAFVDASSIRGAHARCLSLVDLRGPTTLKVLDDPLGALTLIWRAMTIAERAPTALNASVLAQLLAHCLSRVADPSKLSRTTAPSRRRTCQPSTVHRSATNPNAISATMPTGSPDAAARIQ
jgi:hypothetical protein